MSFYVYFIQREDNPNGPVKIGYSNDPLKRIKTLQTANSEKLKLCISMPFDTEDEARHVEKSMHYLANKKCKRLNGEWYMLYMSWTRFIKQSMTIHDSRYKRSK